jgi:hypothetical protein
LALEPGRIHRLSVLLQAARPIFDLLFDEPRSRGFARCRTSAG